MYLDIKSLNIHNPQELLTDLEEYFFNFKILDADLNSYVGTSTYRAFRHQDRIKGAVSLGFKAPVSIITKNLDEFINKYSDKINCELYDEWHSKNLNIYKNKLNENGVFSATLFNEKTGESYNSYAKPFNLLIWNYAFGIIKGKANYNRKDNPYLSYVFHPAVDSDILRGIRVVTSKIMKPEFNIPQNASMAFIDNKEKYDLLLKYMRDLCKNFKNENTGKNISPLALESFWRMKNL